MSDAGSDETTSSGAPTGAVSRVAASVNGSSVKGSAFSIKVAKQDGSGQPFKVTSSTKLSKILSRFISEMGVGPRFFRFYIDGKRLPSGEGPNGLPGGNFTVGDYGMVDGDQIDATVEQKGGGFA